MIKDGLIVNSKKYIHKIKINYFCNEKQICKTMSFIKIYIHLVWSTKNREPFLKTKQIREKVWRHIKENAIEKGIVIDFINGYTDHCHCLVSMGRDQTISKIAQLIKGESSFWINSNKLIDEKFGWQDEYFAVSVSESMIEKVRNYIRKQEEHHANKTYEQEMNQFFSVYGFGKYQDENFNG